MDSEIIQRTKGVKEFRGPLSYGESVKAWNTIRLKKEFINEFSKLKEMQSRFDYRNLLYDSYEELIEGLKKMKKNGDPIPILLSFIKVSDSKGFMETLKN